MLKRKLMAELCEKTKRCISMVGVRRGYDRDHIIISAEVCRGVIRKTKAKLGFKKCFCCYVRSKSGKEITTNGLSGTLTANAGKHEVLYVFFLSVSTNRCCSPKAGMKKWRNSRSRGHSAQESPRKSCLIQFY